MCIALYLPYHLNDSFIIDIVYSLVREPDFILWNYRLWLTLKSETSRPHICVVVCEGWNGELRVRLFSLIFSRVLFSNIYVFSYYFMLLRCNYIFCVTHILYLIWQTLCVCKLPIFPSPIFRLFFLFFIFACCNGGNDERYGTGVLWSYLFWYHSTRFR